MIRIVTDSTCDLPKEWMKQHDIYVVPIHIQFGADTFRDGETIGPLEFYGRIERDGMLPKTSQPPPGDFIEAYRALAAQADEIISLHVTSKLSGTYDSARMAAETVAERVKVHVFDSLAGSSILGYMCLEAARMVEAGKGAAEILKRLETTRPQANIFFTLANLKFAQMSGRVGKLQSALASLLNVQPIVRLENGLLDMTERVRTRKKAIERIIEMTRERVGNAPVNLAVLHAQAADEGAEFLEEAKRALKCHEAFVHDLALSLAVHFGPGALALATYPVE